MARQPVEKCIDGENYRFMLMSPTTSLDMLTKLADVLGPTISRVFASFDRKQENTADIMNLNVNTAILGDAIALLCSRMHENKISEIIKVFTKNVISLGATGTKGSGQINDQVFDEHFQGRLLHLMKVFICCLEVQYADFLDAFGGKVGFLKHLATMSAKQTSPVGNGISGDQ